MVGSKIPLACPLLIDFSGLLFSYLTYTTSIGFLQYFLITIQIVLFIVPSKYIEKSGRR